MGNKCGCDLGKDQNGDFVMPQSARCQDDTVTPNTDLQSCAQSSSSNQGKGVVGCVEKCHVNALLERLVDEHANLFDDHFEERCRGAFRELDVDDSGFLESEELSLAVERSIPSDILTRRLHVDEASVLALAFDEDADGKIDLEEFTRFCQWILAMEIHGYFAGAAPLAQVAEAGVALDNSVHSRLLLVSEYLDSQHLLQQCALPNVKCVYYEPLSLTLNEFSAQLEAAAYIRRKQRTPFQSVALANHGPTDDGFWYVCMDQPVHLSSTDQSWQRLMPLLRALADMVAGSEGDGNVDLLACNFASTEGGVNCISMIQREVGGKFSASTDATGNVASGGNWNLELGNRNVAPIYFDECRLADFETLMKPGSDLPEGTCKVPNKARKNFGMPQANPDAFSKDSVKHKKHETAKGILAAAGVKSRHAGDAAILAQMARDTHPKRVGGLTEIVATPADKACKKLVHASGQAATEVKSGAAEWSVGIMDYAQFGEESLTCHANKLMNEHLGTITGGPAGKETQTAALKSMKGPAKRQRFRQ